MVKFFIIISLGLVSASSSLSNPIEMPPTIVEIHFGASGYDWSLEMLLTYYSFDNLDNIRIKSLGDSALFMPGITFIPGTAFVITPDDLQTPFFINPAGDILFLEEYIAENDFWWMIDMYGLPFGNIPEIYDGEVSAPVGEESVAWQIFTYNGQGYSEYFWIVKELPNTIGSNPCQVTKRGTFSGFVKDRDGEPMPGILLDYCSSLFYYYTSPTVPYVMTDENGYFFSDNMFCKKYNFRFLFNDGIIGDSTVFIEPDSANYFEFKLDTLLTGINDYEPVIPGYSIYNIPNPSSAQTKFIIETTNPKPDHKSVIKIYSEAGFIVDIIPVEILGNKQEISYNFNDKLLAAGMYFYNLETGHQKVASGKMIVTL